MAIRSNKEGIWSEVYLKTIADAEDGHAELKDGRVDVRRVGVIDRVRRSGENDTYT